MTIKRKLFVVALAVFFITPGFAPIGTFTKSAIPNFSSFQSASQNGEEAIPQGVYVPNILALPIVQQPTDNPYYVSNHDGEVTQFGIVSQYGNIGLLAHNNLSGRSFSQLSLGQEVQLVYGEGRVEKFVITKVLRFQALQPESQQSLFLNLDNAEILSANQLFDRAYTGSRHLTFQTCIKAYGNVSWGRLFIVATPKGQ